MALSAKRSRKGEPERPYKRVLLSCRTTKGSRKKKSFSTHGQAIKALPPPPSSLMAIGTFF